SFPITLIVSKPAIPPVIVPEVVRMTLIDAKNTLERVGLRLGTVTYEQPNTTPGVLMARVQVRPCTVIRQDPVKDRPVRAGTPVNVWVTPWLDPNMKQLDCLKANNNGLR